MGEPLSGLALHLLRCLPGGGQLADESRASSCMVRQCTAVLYHCLRDGIVSQTVLVCSAQPAACQGAVMSHSSAALRLLGLSYLNPAPFCFTSSHPCVSHSMMGDPLHTRRSFPSLAVAPSCCFVWQWPPPPRTSNGSSGRGSKELLQASVTHIGGEWLVTWQVVCVGRHNDRDSGWQGKASQTMDCFCCQSGQRKRGKFYLGKD